MESTQALNAEATHQFHEEGFLRVPNLLSADEVAKYRELYDRFLNGSIDSGHLRADLGKPAPKTDNTRSSEGITQIMWPSALVPTLEYGPLHRRVLAMAQSLYGGDMQIDFDMLINKPPNSESPTPWHQDAAYWIDLPDRRALSFWVALDEATVDNGCMWFVPRSHHAPMRQHHQPQGIRALQCDCSEDEGTPVPLAPGEATIHHGGTLHYSRGNSTRGDRRAFIINCRPQTMIRMEREQGMDHGLSDNTTQVRSR